MDAHGLTTIRTFTSESEADVASGALEAFEIECELQRDDCGGQRPSMSFATGIRLLVRNEDLSRAEDALAPLPVDTPHES